MYSTIVNNLTAGVLLAESGSGGLFPPQSSSVASAVDRLFYIIAGISAFFFILIVVLMTYFVIRYRRRPGHEVQKSPSHNTLLEIFWSVVPGALLVLIFALGFITYLDMRNAPDDAYEVKVVARKWSWSFQYPNGVVLDELHLPVNRAARLLMSSEDVIHSLFVPAFRIKHDVVPGRYAQTWVYPNRPGTFRLYCAEYCGQQHSMMNADVIVHEPGEFETWLRQEEEQTNNLPPVELGALLYKRQGCVQCHANDQSTSGKAGPTFAGSFGTTQVMKSGEQITVDENYLRQSILEPLAEIRAGYQPVMPTYKGRLKEKEIDALIAYIKSLKESTSD